MAVLSCFPALQVVAFQQPELSEYVIIKPAWLYTDLVSLIMSEDPLPKPYVQYENGYAKLDDVIKLLQTAHPDVTGELAVTMLSELGFMIVVKGRALVPVKLKEERPEQWWPRIPKHMSEVMVFAGRRLRFVGLVGPSSALFPLTQSRFYHLFIKKYANELPLWAGGIRIASGKFPGAIALIEARPVLCCIDVFVRGRVEFADQCYQLLHILSAELMAMVNEHSPGSKTERLFLSGSELARLSEDASLAAPRIAYSKDSVCQALERSEHVTDGKASDPEDPACLMLSDDEWLGKKSFTFQIFRCSGLLFNTM